MLQAYKWRQGLPQPMQIKKSVLPPFRGRCRQKIAIAANYNLTFHPEELDTRIPNRRSGEQKKIGHRK
jgi:hypothetical protein